MKISFITVANSIQLLCKQQQISFYFVFLTRKFFIKLIVFIHFIIMILIIPRMLKTWWSCIEISNHPSLLTWSCRHLTHPVAPPFLPSFQPFHQHLNRPSLNQNPSSENCYQPNHVTGYL